MVVGIRFFGMQCACWQAVMLHTGKLSSGKSAAGASGHFVEVPFTPAPPPTDAAEQPGGPAGVPALPPTPPLDPPVPPVPPCGAGPHAPSANPAINAITMEPTSA